MHHGGGMHHRRRGIGSRSGIGRGPHTGMSHFGRGTIGRHFARTTALGHFRRGGSSSSIHMRRHGNWGTSNVGNYQSGVMSAFTALYTSIALTPNRPFGDMTTEYYDSASFWWNLQSNSRSREINDDLVISTNVHTELRASPPITLQSIQLEVFGQVMAPAAAFDQGTIATMLQQGAAQELAQAQAIASTMLLPTQGAALGANMATATAVYPATGGVDSAPQMQMLMQMQQMNNQQPNPNMNIGTAQSLQRVNAMMGDMVQQPSAPAVMTEAEAMAAAMSLMSEEPEFKDLYADANNSISQTSVQSAEVQAQAIMAALGLSPPGVDAAGNEIADPTLMDLPYGARFRKEAELGLWVNLQPDETGLVSDITGNRYTAVTGINGTATFNYANCCALFVRERRMTPEIFAQTWSGFCKNRSLDENIPSPQDVLDYADIVEEVYGSALQWDILNWDSQFNAAVKEVQLEQQSNMQNSMTLVCGCCPVPDANKYELRKRENGGRTFFPHSAALLTTQDEFLAAPAVMARYSEAYNAVLVAGMPVSWPPAPAAPTIGSMVAPAPPQMQFAIADKDGRIML